MPRPATVTLEQVSAELQLSMRTIYRRVKDGSIPAFKMGSVWRCPASYVDKLRSDPSATLASGAAHEQEKAIPAGNPRPC